MAFLHRYSIRIQQRRIVSVDALNSQHAKQLAEEDVLAMEDSEKIQAQNSVLVAEATGHSEPGGQQLDRFDVTVRFRRNILLDAEDFQSARVYAEQDQQGWEDTEPGSIQYQQVTFIKEKTGTT